MLRVAGMDGPRYIFALQHREEIEMEMMKMKREKIIPTKTIWKKKTVNNN